MHKKSGPFLSVIVAATLCFPVLIQAATTTTVLDGANSAMGVTGQSCLQNLVNAVSEGENCMYDGGPNVYEFSPGSGIFPVVPFGESTGPFNWLQYYDFGTTVGQDAFNNADTFAPTNDDGKIRRVINGSITVDDQGDGFGANDLIGFTFTITSPLGGDIVRLGFTGWADRFTSMTQVLVPRVADSVSANAFGGFDYVIGTEGFPLLLTFTDPNAGESVPGAGDGPCVGQTFGDMECGAGFQALLVPPLTNFYADPLRWTFYDDGSMPPLNLCMDPNNDTSPLCWRPTDATTWIDGAIPTPPGQFDVPHVGPPGSPGLGTMEGNVGARTSGSLVLVGVLGRPEVTCNDSDGGVDDGTCQSGKDSFNPLLNGPNLVSGGIAEDSDWDQVYLKVSTDARGNVLTAEGFDVQETQIFSVPWPCGSDPGAPIDACNTWVAGHFTIVGVLAGPDTDEDGIVDAADNCTLAPNGPGIPDAGGNMQRDTDGDGYGNVCDADLNNDTFVNSLDLGLFKLVFMTADADADLNGDGLVNSLDLGLFKNLFFQPPGPSGLAP